LALSVSRPAVVYRRQQNLALVFCLFNVVVYFVTDACLLLLCFIQFSSTKPRDWLWTTSPKWPTLFRVGRKTLTQSISGFWPYLLNCSVTVRNGQQPPVMWARQPVGKVHSSDYRENVTLLLLFIFIHRNGRKKYNNIKTIKKQPNYCRCRTRTRGTKTAPVWVLTLLYEWYLLPVSFCERFVYSCTRATPYDCVDSTECWLNGGEDVVTDAEWQRRLWLKFFTSSAHQSARGGGGEHSKHWQFHTCHLAANTATL